MAESPTLTGLGMIALYVHVSENTVTEWIREGLPVTRIRGHIVTNKILIDEWVIKRAKKEVANCGKTTPKSSRTHIAKISKFK